jgi:hypothetical protein
MADVRFGLTDMAWRRPMLACLEWIESEEAVFGLEEVDFCLTGMASTGPAAIFGQAKIQMKQNQKINDENIYMMKSRNP